MIFPELQIQLDLNPDNKVNILDNVDTCTYIDIGYLFVDQEDGQFYLFDENGNLDDIDQVQNIRKWAFENCESLTSIKIPNSVKHIGNGAFFGCSSLKSINIPSSVKYIGQYAFYICTSLKELVFKSKTMDEVKAMYNYPWGIKDESVIKIEN